MGAKFPTVLDGLVGRLRSQPPGTALPTERELAAQYQVSRMTLRRALAELVDRGLIERRHGVGTFVARPKIAQPLTATSFTEDMRRRGLRPSARVLGSTLLILGPELAEQLEQPTGSQALAVRRLRLADDEPMALETLHVSTRTVPGLDPSALDDHSWYELLETRYGHTVASGKQWVEPVVITEADAADLEVGPGLPAFAFTRISRDANGQVLEYVRAIYRGDRYRIEVDLTPPVARRAPPAADQGRGAHADTSPAARSGA